MNLVKWTELNQGRLEVRVPCPHCKSLNYFSGHDNPIFFGQEMRKGVQQSQCQNRKKFFGIKLEKAGATAI